MTRPKLKYLTVALYHPRVMKGGAQYVAKDLHDMAAADDGFDAVLLNSAVAHARDPVRMAHGILTGVGFLGGGVIFRSGFNVHGLTTAASVWTTSCIGILFGIGFWEVAISGTVLALTVLAGFRLIDQRLPQQSLADITIRYARGAAPGAEELRERLKALGLKSAPLSERLLKKGQYIEHGATVSALNRLAIDRLAAELRADHKVIEFEIEPRNA